MKKNTMEYTAPEMEIVLAMVENGFQTSFETSDILFTEEDEYGPF
jgi:hypothetical protein